MVKRLSSNDKDAIAHAIQEAEARTSCEVVIAIAPACDAYYSFAILFGLILGSAIDLGLWASAMNCPVPLLLLIQVAAIAVFVELPFMRHLTTSLVPMRIKQVRAAQRAAAEYGAVCQKLPPEIPLVMIFISLAERYIHVFGNGHLSTVLPDSKLQEIAHALADAIGSKPLADACVETVQSLSVPLAMAYPFASAPHHFSDAIIEPSL